MQSAKKLIGYILAALGIAALALSFEPIKALVKMPLPAQLTSNYLLVGGLVLIIVGIFFLLGRKILGQEPEVPIYRGRRIVGYRRHK